MAAETSPTTGRRYGIAEVCRIWDVPRSSFYADRHRADTKRALVPAQRRGPKVRSAWRRVRYRRSPGVRVN